MTFNAKPTARVGWTSEAGCIFERIARIATGSTSLYIFTGGRRLALAIPSSRRAARLVIDLYQAQRLKGRIFKQVARLIGFLKLPCLCPSYRARTAIIPQVEWLRSAAEVGTIGFLGCNPTHGLRCVLAGYDPKTRIPFIAKLGMDEAALAIEREHDILSAIPEHVPGVIKSLGLEKGPDWALLRLPHLGNQPLRAMAEPKIVDLLCAWQYGEKVPINSTAWAEKLLSKISDSQAPDGWLERIKSYSIRPAFLHGDFAVWNLRVVDGHLHAIDLEWADQCGISGIDLVHGLRQEAFMVRKMNPSMAISWMAEELETRKWSVYLEHSGWRYAIRDLISIGLLHSHFNALNDSSELLRVQGFKL